MKISPLPWPCEISSSFHDSRNWRILLDLGEGDGHLPVLHTQRRATSFWTLRSIDYPVRRSDDSSERMLLYQFSLFQCTQHLLYISSFKFPGTLTMTFVLRKRKGQDFLIFNWWYLRDQCHDHNTLWRPRDGKLFELAIRKLNRRKRVSLKIDIKRGTLTDLITHLVNTS